MSLDVTAGLPGSGAGSGPPGQAGPPGGLAPPGDLSALFATLLAGQGKPAGTKSLASVGVPTRTAVAPTKPTSDSSASDGPAEPRKEADKSGDPAEMPWTLIPALMTPAPSQPPMAAETTASRKPATKHEAMDTSPAPTLPAASGTAARVGGELLPQTGQTATAGQSGAGATVYTPQFDTSGMFTAAGLSLPVGASASVPAAAQQAARAGEAESPSRMSGEDVTPILAESVGSGLGATDLVAPSQVPGSPPAVPFEAVPGAVSLPLPTADSAENADSTRDDGMPSEKVTAGLAPKAAPVTPDKSVPVSLGSVKTSRVSARAAVSIQAADTLAVALSPDATPLGLKMPAAVLTLAALQNNPAPANNTGKAADGLPAKVPGQTDSKPQSSGAAGVVLPTAVVSPVKTPGATLTGGAEVKPTAQTAPRGPSARLARTETSGVSKPNNAPREQKTEGASEESEAKPTTNAVLPAQAVTTPEKSINTAPVVSKSLTGAERAEIVRQVAAGAGALQARTAAGGEGQMTLQLHPRDWGEVRLSVRVAPAVSAEGAPTTSVVAHVVAGSPAVKSALEAHLGDLRHTLRETGLRLDRLTVTVQSPGSSAQAGGAASDGGAFSGQGYGQSSRASEPSSPSAATGTGAGFGTGGSSFAGFSERQGQGPVPRPSLGPTAGGADTGESETAPVSRLSRAASAGFDQRA